MPDEEGLDQWEQSYVRRSTRECQLSTKYPAIDYILLTDGIGGGGSLNASKMQRLMKTRIIG